MADWYYHDAAQGRVGPLSAEDLQARYRERRIQRDTLVWREGLREWQPLDRLSEELGLDGIQQDTAKPPPLPPGGPIGVSASTAYAGPAAGAGSGSVRTDVRYSAPPKRGMSGCLIAVIVLAVLAVPMVGILAAIALPAYQDYTLRTKTAQSFNEANAVKLAVAEHMAANGRCPSNGDDGFGEATDYASATTAQIKIGTMRNGHCALEIELRGIGPKVDGKTIWFEAIPTGDRVDWDCSGGDLPAIYRPGTCRPGTSISNG
ncbi:GYF domain-containing protein [Lysobacter sp. Root983]|uniref:GYF domain-containing protein n=1 Tax=Lysobacter sp. Root983 TaxID=1736613 RepID=UPI00070E0C43|nr:GYF domain-containing protein [Lysobacter sp. Root983]KRD77020.1 hypothetical protein ASE43_07495 [Lysobacter sp. Root983]